MLAVDSTGGLYSWGSNRFGQLGRSGGKASGGSGPASCESNLLPQRVEKLRRLFVTGIAAGK
jgi:alpha-tubulin suppressor-like RCC1 family protein